MNTVQNKTCFTFLSSWLAWNPRSGAPGLLLVQRLASLYAMFWLAGPDGLGWFGFLYFEHVQCRRP